MSANASQQVLQALRDARARVEALQKQRDEPIAIVGIGCRFPAADSPETFWSMVRDGVDATCDFPADRHFEPYYDPDPDREGRTYTRRGGYFPQRPDRFDARFFGVSPREAEAMDPQQRLLLEVVWEALENAGIAADSLRRSSTGVFVGLSTDDYHRLITSVHHPESLTAFASLGGHRSVAAGRISYLYGFQGPTIQLDTACSSSLVAVHLACQSLRAGESNLALAAGVNLILSAESPVSRCRMRALSPDGRCKTFDASADGYGEGEGCGVVVLKRLSDAHADGDTVLAVIRGSAVNHDGPASALTAPNELAQEQLIRRALASAKLDPAEVAYVEAHGTGTALGDPIEVNALGAVFAKRDRPLYIGSVKSNIGHCEAAAGVSSLIKTVLAIHHRELPPHLHFRRPNPYISWNELPVKVVTERTPWPEGPRIAGISSFGLSGTNAHVIVAEPSPVPDVPAPAAAARHLLCLSAKTRAALAGLVRRYAGHLRASTDPIADLCFTANAGRSHHAHRIAVIGSTAAEIADRLERATPSDAAPAVPLTIAFRGDADADVIADPADLDRLAALYREGAAIDWRGFGRGRRVRLPNYPFEHERFWSDTLPAPHPRSAVTDLLDTGDVAGLESLLGGGLSREQRQIIETLVARHRGAANWFYRVEWEPATDPAPSAAIDYTPGDDDPAVEAARFLRFLQTESRPTRVLTSGRLNEAPVAGIAKVAALEHPDRIPAVVERPGFVPRLNRATVSGGAPLTLRPDATYLITGGTGALGAHVARWLVDRGARRLVLASRRGGDAPRISGADIRVANVDAADRDALRALIDTLPDLRGVIHAAGVGGPRQAVLAMSAAALGDVLRPKVAGGWNLHELTAHLPLDFFVLFSSIASVWGSKTQAHYTAANHYLDALAAYRCSLGLPATAINWGPWEGTIEPEAAQWLRRSGVRPLPPARALDALEAVLRAGETQVVVADIDWPTFLPVFEAKGPAPLFANLGAAQRAPEPAAAAAPAPALSRAEAVAKLQQLVARVLGDGTLPDPHQGFADLGLDSLMAVELKKLVEDAFARPVSATVIFNYPTVDKLATYLLGPDAKSQPEAPAHRDEIPSDAHELMALLAKEAEV